MRQLAIWVQAKDPRVKALRKKGKAKVIAGTMRRPTPPIRAAIRDVSMLLAHTIRHQLARTKDLSPSTEATNGTDEQVQECGTYQAPMTFDCAACNKTFKSAQQLSNHEQSTKHKKAVAKLKKQLETVEGFKDLAVDDDEEEEDGEEEEEEKKETKPSGKGKRKGRKGKKGAEEAADDAEDAGEEVQQAAPTPELVAVESREAFEASADFKKMNKTQRRKAIQQWEAENEFYQAALRKAGKAPKAAVRAPYVV